MSEKFQNKYRIASARLQHWDYSWNGAYFVTICTKNRECFFGEVVNGVMDLSKIGVIADILWYEIKNHAKNIELGEYVVMPNHVHGIVILNGNDGLDVGGVPDGSNARDVRGGSGGSGVETRHALSLPQPQSQSQSQPPSQPQPGERFENEKTMGQKRFQNQGKNTVSSIVGGYKSAVSKHARRLGLEFAWQSRFHDHIIRDEKSFHTISQYIVNNPVKWQEDRFFN